MPRTCMTCGKLVSLVSNLFRHACCCCLCPAQSTHLWVCLQLVQRSSQLPPQLQVHGVDWGARNLQQRPASGVARDAQVVAGRIGHCVSWGGGSSGGCSGVAALQWSGGSRCCKHYETIYVLVGSLKGLWARGWSGAFCSCVGCGRGVRSYNLAAFASASASAIALARSLCQAESASWDHAGGPWPAGGHGTAAALSKPCGDSANQSRRIPSTRAVDQTLVSPNAAPSGPAAARGGAQACN